MAENLTPDNQKTTGEKMKETVTNFADKTAVSLFFPSFSFIDFVLKRISSAFIPQDNIIFIHNQIFSCSLALFLQPLFFLNAILKNSSSFSIFQATVQPNSQKSLPQQAGDSIRGSWDENTSIRDTVSDAGRKNFS